MAETTKYWDDLQVGDRFETMGRTITEADLARYAGLTADAGELFVNVEYAVERGPFGKRIVPGLLTVTVAVGLHGLLGWFRDMPAVFHSVDQIRFISPVPLGGTIYSTVEVAEKILFRHGDRGIVALLHTVHDSDLHPHVEFTTRWRMPLRNPVPPEG